MWFRRGLPVLVFAFCSWCLPSHAGNLFTINNSDGQGVSGGLLATPPGTCTGVPGGLPGHCEARASAAVQAWATGNFGSGTNWSDATDTSVPLPAGTRIIGLDGTPGPIITSADLVDNVNTKIGTSWIPEVCNRPWCGNLLRGDVISHLDENGDGVWNDTWIDDGDGIREAGEVDRTRAEQFAWGLTSVMRNLSEVSLVAGNVSPPGISRMRPRIALGDAGQNPDAGCDGDIMNPKCHNAVVTPPDPTGLLTPGNTVDDDAAVFGRCDPDRPEFTALIPISPVRAQRALDNCLWYFSSFPVTAPSPGSFDPLHNTLRPDGEGFDPLPPSEGGDDVGAVRDSWINQQVVKYVASSSAFQNYSQNLLATVWFRAAPDAPDDTRDVIYHNEWRLSQSDDLANTYPYNFLMQHTTEGRRRGFTQDPTVPISECLPPLTGPACDGQTNPTVDPFWGQAIVRDLSGDPVLDAEGAFTLNFDQEFDWFAGKPCDQACRESGVGHKEDFSFLYEQIVEGGFLLSCLNCGHPPPAFADTVTYSFTWPGIPSIVSVPHPPPATTVLPVLP